MIWALDFFKAVPWRLIGAVAALGAVGVLGWRVAVWHAAYERVGALEDQLEAEVACTEPSECWNRQKALEAEAAIKAARVVEDYEREIDELRNRPVTVRTVRLCPDRGRVPGAGATGRTDAGTAAAGEFPAAPGPDIGVGLYALAREADEIVARCRGLQSWNRALSAD